jgi:hypothetical protein
VSMIWQPARPTIASHSRDAIARKGCAVCTWVTSPASAARRGPDPAATSLAPNYNSRPVASPPPVNQPAALHLPKCVPGRFGGLSYMALPRRAG